jgi:argininosuccinate synthase
MSRIVFAYSGSARASVALRWMIEAWQAEVVTLTLDLGQRDELDAVRERALACGAIRAHVLDERESFARDYLLRALRAGAAAEPGWPLGRLLTRPLIARRLADVAKMEGVTDIAHSAAPDREDRQRLERAMRDAGPDLIVRAPLVDADLSDDELLAFAADHRLPIPPLDPPFDVTLFERCTRGVGAEASGTSGVGFAEVAIEFARGTPVGLNGVTMPLLEIISSLDTIAAAEGVGTTQQLVRRPDGAVVSERCEAPAAVVLDAALRQLQRLALSSDSADDAQRVATIYRDILWRGAWETASRRGCDAFVDAIQTRVTGTVRVRLQRGSLAITDCTLADERVDVLHISR